MVASIRNILLLLLLPWLRLAVLYSDWGTLLYHDEKWQGGWLGGGWVKGCCWCCWFVKGNEWVIVIKVSSPADTLRLRGDDMEDKDNGRRGITIIASGRGSDRFGLDWIGRVIRCRARDKWVYEVSGQQRRRRRLSSFLSKFIVIHCEIQFLVSPFLYTLCLCDYSILIQLISTWLYLGTVSMSLIAQH